jgi:putative FmdB family regulatory protein
MPTYEYRCTACGHRFDVFQRIEDDPLTTCERCGGELRKVFHPAGIVFKGSGFYATDSRRSSKTTTGSDAGTSSDDRKSEKSGETKSGDSKKDTSSGSKGTKETAASEPKKAAT